MSLASQQVVVNPDEWDAAAWATVEVLSNKERVFLLEYLHTWDVCKAALKAGYSARSAKVYGYQLLRKPRIAEALAKFTEHRIGTAAMNVDLLVEQAIGDMSDFFTIVEKRKRDGTRFDVAVLDLAKGIDLGKGRLIKKVKVNSRTGEPIELELYSATEAIQLLMRSLGQFKDKVDLTVDWRSEIAATGANPDDVREQLKAVVRGFIAPSAGPTSGGSDAGDQG